MAIDPNFSMIPVEVPVSYSVILCQLQNSLDLSTNSRLSARSQHVHERVNKTIYEFFVCECCVIPLHQGCPVDD